MSTTQASPPTPPETEGQPDRDPVRGRRRRSARPPRIGDSGEYDLLHVIEDLEDERARVALREKIWIALILHFVLFLCILFAPRYIPRVKVRDSTTSQSKDKMTVLQLPPDALKNLTQPRPAAKAAPAPRPQASKAPAAPPAPKAAPAPKPLPPAPQPRPAPTPPAPQMAQQPAPRPAPVPPAQNAQVDAPRPQPSKPNFATPQSAADNVQQAARAARGSSGTITDEGGAPGGPQSGRAADKGAVDILSDTLGVDFGPYIQRVIYATKKAWYPIIPEVARPPISKEGRVLIRFKILKDGSITEMKLEGPSGTVALDRAAWAGIVGAGPYPFLPKEFKGPFLELRFYFIYNDANGGIR
ncbi:energy transducer TonB [Acidipila sp. EB88]|uniref:energy transducer TonB family protein n=1 Tax=Acidipila sp. EB88 TaxID=2305226 RepID=UPI000F5E2C85|nr:energy transducer TonB [Acidipila sp. EB88]RRA48317.1 TonB family protein [Acidipila sp. EB88]